MKRNIILIFTILSVCNLVYAQPRQVIEINFYDSIKHFDLSKLWKCDTLTPDMHIDQFDTRVYTLPEPLGFIGDHYQRFYIHYTSIRKNKKNPYQYIVAGKTRVKNNICTFHGTISVKTAIYYLDSYINLYQGELVGECLFYEDKAKKESGVFRGKLTSGWYIDITGHLLYDDQEAVADGYSNNEFTGTWTSYKTHISRKCNWGDYRIPNSGDLDGGSGVFCVNEKYLKYGWQSYHDFICGNSDSTTSAKATVIENEMWWKR